MQWSSYRSREKGSQALIQAMGGRPVSCDAKCRQPDAKARLPAQLRSHEMRRLTGPQEQNSPWRLSGAGGGDSGEGRAFPLGCWERLGTRSWLRLHRAVNAFDAAELRTRLTLRCGNLTSVEIKTHCLCLMVFGHLPG